MPSLSSSLQHHVPSADDLVPYFSEDRWDPKKNVSNSLYHICFYISLSSLFLKRNSPCSSWSLTLPLVSRFDYFIPMQRCHSNIYPSSFPLSFFLSPRLLPLAYKHIIMSVKKRKTCLIYILFSYCLISLFRTVQKFNFMSWTSFSLSSTSPHRLLPTPLNRNCLCQVTHCHNTVIGNDKFLVFTLRIISFYQLITPPLKHFLHKASRMPFCLGSPASLVISSIFLLLHSSL